MVVGQFVVPAFVEPAAAAGLSTNFFDYPNHDVATATAGLVDWANNGALTSSNVVGSTWTRAGSQGVFNGGVYNGGTKPPTAPTLTAAGAALKAAGTIESAAFVADPISSDSGFSCQSPSGPVTISGDPTTFAGAGSETNNGQLNTFTYGSSGNTPPKDDLSNVFGISHNTASANEIFFGGERIVNNGASHIDFEFLQANLSVPNPCAAGTMTGHRTQRDLLLSTDFTNGGALAGAQLYLWSCNGKAPGAAGYDASKDFTVCDPAANGNPGNGDPQYVAVPMVQSGNQVASFGVNTGANGITCGGWVCRDSSGTGTTTLLQNAFMEGGIDLAAAGFTGCINTFLPHTRSSPSFTSVLKDFAGPIAFSNCKTPTVTTQQSSAGVTSGANITAGIGASVTDTATLHGTAPHVGGTVAYKLFSNAACTTQVGSTSTKTINGSPDGNGDLVLPASDPITPPSTGTYYWTAAYSGDTASGGQNNSATSACGAEVLTVVAPSLSITKTADAPTVSAGDAMGFTIAVNNSGQGAANNVTITDALPAGTGVSWSINPAYAGPGTCGITGAVPTQSLSCNLGTLATSGSASVHVTSPTARASCGTYPNSATVAATNNPTVPPATASVTVLCPNLSISKTADSTSVSAGTPIGFTIVVSNAGPGVAKSVTLTDALPSGSGINWSISPAQAGCSIAAGSLSCSFGDLASGASASVHVTSPTVFSSCSTYPNTALAQATNNPQVSASASTSVQCPGLQISKIADAGTVSAGDPIGFSISVSNTGAGTATGVTLSDPLPGGAAVNWSISPAKAGCSIAGTAPNQTLNCAFGDLLSNTSTSVHVTSATANASCGAYPNTATATATNDGSVQASASINVNCPNLTIAKSADASTVNVGSNIGFTITVSNTGAGIARAAAISDALPTGAGISWSISPVYSGPGTCSVQGSTLTCALGDLAPGGSAQVHVTSATSVGTPCTTYPNTASAQATNNPQVQASASTTLRCPALQITKIADATSVSAGDPIGFTMTVSNTGAGTATGVTLTDPLPGGAGVSWSISPVNAACSITGVAPNQSLNCAFGDLASAASATVHVTSNTSRSSCAAYPNTATAAATNAQSVQASASITVQCPNLAIEKSADSSTVSAGSAIGFTITVSNPGPGTAKAVTLSDPLPGGPGIVWSVDPADAACSITGSAPNQSLGCAFGDMAPAASASVHVTSPTSGATPCAAYPNTASAQATNNPQVQASASTSVQCPGLQISKAADATSVSAGDPIGFTIVVSNTGAGTATGVTLNDPLPTGSGISWSISPAKAGCSMGGATLSCSFGNMAPGASNSVHVTSATVFASCGAYPNTATASATNSGSVEASASITVNCPNLTIDKTADAASVSAGDPIGFTVTVGNSGTGTAKAVTLSDPLPTGTGIGWSISPAQAGCSIGGATLTCSFGDLASGVSTSVHVISATEFASCAAYPNTATAVATNHASVQALAGTTVQCPNLSISKTADASPVSTGNPIGFSVTVQNSGAPGTGTAKAVTLSDPLPSGDGVSWSINPAYTGAGTCSITGVAPSQSLDCTFGDMAPGASNSIHVVSATTAASAGTYPNTATASATNQPSVQASATIVVLAPNLSIVKVADQTPVSTGDPIGFSVTVSNSGAAGTGTALGVTLSDPLPSGNGVSWSISPAYSGPGTCSITGVAPNQSLGCSFGDMAPGASNSVHVVSATTSASAGTYPNTATASATNTGSVQASATIVVLAPNLTITKTADATSVDAGAAIGFTITVGNDGPGLARSVSLNDPLPTGTGVSWSISPAVPGCSITANTLSCTLGDVAAQGSVSVHVTSATEFASCGAYPNTATLSATNADSIEAWASITVNCPNLTIDKVADATSVSAGDPIGFSITVGNSGPGTAHAVALADPLPTGSGIAWSIDPATPGCTITANTLNCAFGELTTQGSASVHITSATSFASCAAYPNTASATASNHPQVSSQASTTVNCPVLSITKTADASPVNTGEPIGFTVTVSNSEAQGTGTAKAVTLSDPLPGGSGVSWSISPAYAGAGTCSITGAVGSQSLDCALGDMAPGASNSVHVMSATTSASAGTYPNTATASATNHPSVDASAAIVVLAPNLSIAKVADQASVSTGDPIGFSVTVSNADSEGTGTAKAVTLSDPLPAGDGVVWSISPAYAGAGTCAVTGAAPNQSLDCSFGDMAPGASNSVHIVSATTADSAGTYPNTATASATNTDSVHASATIVVLAPSLTIIKTADAQQVTAPAAIGFTVEVANADVEGTGIARSVTLSDPLPGGTGVSWSIAPAYSGPGTCSITGSAPHQTLTCSFGDMAPGASTSVHITSATTNASVGNYENTATASATNGTPVEATATTKVIVDVPVRVQETPTTTTTTVPAPRQPLPFTGANAAALAAVALVLMATGAALALSRRRRRAA
jgi:uncharacterized repeat protein (TIGR01451 family)